MVVNKTVIVNKGGTVIVNGTRVFVAGTSTRTRVITNHFTVPGTTTVVTVDPVTKALPVKTAFVPPGAWSPRAARSAPSALALRHAVSGPVAQTGMHLNGASAGNIVHRSFARGFGGRQGSAPTMRGGHSMNAPSTGGRSFGGRSMSVPPTEGRGFGGGFGGGCRGGRC